MSNVTLRDLSRHTGKVVAGVAATRRPALVTSRGRVVAAVVPIDDDALADWVLANAPEFVSDMAAAEREFESGRTVRLEDAFLEPSEGAAQ